MLSCVSCCCVVCVVGWLMMVVGLSLIVVFSLVFGLISVCVFVCWLSIVFVWWFCWKCVVMMWLSV